MGELLKFPQEEPEQVKKYLDMNKLMSVLHALTNIFKTIPITNREEVLKTYMKQVSGYTDEELIGWLNNSTEEKVEDKPLFFHAIVEISRTRDFFPKTREK